MTVAAYPATLPGPSVTGFVVRPVYNVLETDLENGPKSARKQMTDKAATMSLNFVMSRAEFAEFERWHAQDTKYGACWFTIDLPSGGQNKQHLLRFRGGFTAKALASAVYNVSADFEVRERPMLTAAEAAAILNG